MKKLTIINQQYPPEVAATGQIFRVMAEHMAGRGFHVTVVTGTPYYPGLTGRVPKKETMGGVHVRRLFNTTFQKKSFLGKLMNLLTFEISLLFYCIFSIGRGETVLVATAPPMAVLCTGAGRFFRRYRVMMTVQDLYPDVLYASGMSSPDGLSYRILKGLMKAAMGACEAVIAISREMGEHLLASYGIEDVKVIPNLFPETIHPIPPEQAKGERGWQSKLVVQYSGNFGVAHEYETLLSTVKALRDTPDILFQIAGAGKHYDALKAACQGFDNIAFEGYAPLDQLEAHLGRGDMAIVIFSEAFRDVLLPSKYYGILASGRGVLLISGCDSDIRRDILSAGAGMAFDHGQGEKIAQALLALARDRERLEKMGHAARQLYDEKYDQGRILAAYEALLMGDR